MIGIFFWWWKLVILHRKLPANTEVKVVEFGSQAEAYAKLDCSSGYALFDEQIGMQSLN